MEQRFQQGDDCPRCGGLIGVLNTRIEENVRVRWIGCHDCGFRPPRNRLEIPIDYSPPRRQRFSRLNFRRGE